MNALVISGGGSKGAFAGGVAEYLMKDCKKSYSIFVGTSTGSLLTPLLASNNIEKAKRVYTQVEQSDIFTHCPFIIEKKDGEYKTRFNHFGIARMFMKGEKTLGDSHNLRKFIEHNFTEEDFNRIGKLQHEVMVTVANLTTQAVEYKSSATTTYQDFCDWLWASANVLPFMSLLEKDGCEYGDGGFGDFIPIQEAIRMGATSVDVIILRPAQRAIKLPPVRNAFQVMTRTYDFMSRQIVNDDMMIGMLEAANKNIDLHFYHTPRLLTEQSFIFDPEQLTAWWQEGYEEFRNNVPDKLVI